MVLSRCIGMICSCTHTYTAYCDDNTMSSSLVYSDFDSDAGNALFTQLLNAMIKYRQLLDIVVFFQSFCCTSFHGKSRMPNGIFSVQQKKNIDENVISSLVFVRKNFPHKSNSTIILCFIQRDPPTFVALSIEIQ